jgi:hypothetical protein
MAFGGGQHEGGVALPVAGVQFRPRLEKVLDDGDVVAGGGDHQRRLREVVHAVDPSLVLKIFLDFFNKVMFIQGAITEGSLFCKKKK